jgi:hypothetical protein
MMDQRNLISLNDTQTPNIVFKISLIVKIDVIRVKMITKELAGGQGDFVLSLSPLQCCKIGKHIDLCKK